MTIPTKVYNPLFSRAYRLWIKGIITSDIDSEYFNNFHPLTSEIWMNGNIPMMTMKFHQKEGSATGFSLSTDRLKNLEFERLNE